MTFSCLGPTLAAVQTLAYREASAGRGALLTAAYCAGLGIPFLLTAVAFKRALGAFAVVKRHYVLVMRIGGLLLVVVGLVVALAPVILQYFDKGSTGTTIEVSIGDSKPTVDVAAALNALLNVSPTPAASLPINPTSSPIPTRM